MYIVQLSDLHFPEAAAEEAAAEERYSKITESLIMTIKAAVPVGETVLLAVCGDLVNRGQPDGFKNIERVLNQIRGALRPYPLQFGFAPGNHDLIDGKLAAFNAFMKEYCKEDNCFETSSCYAVSVVEDGTETKVIFINSVYGGDRDKGIIHYDDLSKLLRDLEPSVPKILVMHHTIMSMDECDRSSILNAARLVELIEKYKVSMLLHGHTHGLGAITVGASNCAVVGVGALFSRNYADVNSQFNLIRFQNGAVTLIQNYTYHSDRAREPEKMLGTSLSLPCRGDRHRFTGEKISRAYDTLISSLKINKKLYNISLSGTYKFDDFKRDVESAFGSQKDFDFDYAILAESWQKDNCPPELYFSHGEHYYKHHGKSGISYIIETLKQKPTSSHAVLSTIYDDLDEAKRNVGLRIQEAIAVLKQQDEGAPS